MKKKWIIVLLVIIVIIGASYFLTNFSVKHEFPINGSNVADIDTEKIGGWMATVCE